eukprot:4760781-Amphidinium_carterae.1
MLVGGSVPYMAILCPHFLPVSEQALLQKFWPPSGGAGRLPQNALYWARVRRVEGAGLCLFWASRSSSHRPPALGYAPHCTAFSWLTVWASS